MSPRLFIRLLGDACLTLDGRPAQGKLYGKVLGLLAYLAVESEQSHSREQLAALLWPRLSTAAARTNLRQALYYLRQAVGTDMAPIFAANRDTVRFLDYSGLCRIDVKELSASVPYCPACAKSFASALCAGCLSQLKSRADAYQGEFLAGMALDDAPEFDAWLDTQRHDLRARAYALAEQLRDACHAQGLLEPALAYARRCTELEPWNESGHRQHMRLLDQKGQHGAAEAFYDGYRSKLARELSLEPDQHTHALFETIHRRAMAPMPSSVRSPVSNQPPAGRRQVTVLCCHVDMAPGTQGDVEQLAEPRSICATLLRRYAGRITQGRQGYIYAYLGYPAASEQAGTLAVQAALALQASVAPHYRFRAGIHTGVIVTGFDPDLPDIVGDVTEVAWQLCKRMHEGGIALSGATESLLRNRFPLRALQPPRSNQTGTAKDDDPVQAYRLLATDELQAMSGAQASSTPLIGRKVELRRLRKSWQQAAAGAPQLLLIRGEAGIGKSRLALALRDFAAQTPAIVRHLHCHPEHRHTPLYPVIAMFETILDLSLDDTLALQRQKLHAYLERHYPAFAAQAEPILMALLSIAPPGRPAQPPRLRKQQTLEMLLTLLDAMAARQPLLLIIEDAHWLDMSSLDLLERLLRRKGRAPVLTLITARNDFAPSWLTPASVLELQPLKDADIARLARATVKSLSPQQVDRIVRRADGIALYAQEMAQAPSHSVGDESGISATLHYLLLTRLDAVPGARRVVQLAATLGRNVERGLLQHVAGMEQSGLDTALAQLIDARLIAASIERDDVFQFRHVLIQEAAYASQTQADKEQAHQAAAEAILAHYAQRAAQQPGEVARHYTLAGNAAAAIPLWLQAGRQALRVSANAEAGEHLQTGLDLLRELPRTEARDALELELLLAQGQATLLLRGYGSDDAALVYDRALALSQDATPLVRRFEILWGQWMVSSSRPGSSFKHSWEITQQLLQLARRSGEEELLAHAYSAAANICLWRNQIDDACRYALAATAADPAIAANTVEGLDPRVTSLAHLSWAYWRLDRIGDALSASRLSLRHAQSRNAPETLCFALSFAAILHRFLGQPDAMADLAQEVRHVADVHHLVLWRGIGDMLLGWKQVHDGHEEGLATLNACVRAARQVMPGVAVMFIHFEADAYGLLGRYREQLDIIDEGLQAARLVHEGFFRQLLERLRLECLAHQTRQ